MSSFRGRYSSHTGSSYSQSLNSPSYGSPYASPRHSYARSPRKGSSTADKTVHIIQAVLLVLFVLAIWKGVSYSLKDTSEDFPDSDCPDCRVQADIPVSDLSIKLATNKPASRGRKDFYQDASHTSRDNRQDIDHEQTHSGENAGTEAAANQQQHSYTSSDAQKQGVERRDSGQQWPLPPQRPQPPARVQPQLQQSAGSAAVQSQQQTASSFDTSADAARARTQAADVAVGAPPASTTPSDLLHDNQGLVEKEAEQLAALSRVVQQQQDTISRQSKALMDLQNRFVQQEHQLQAATASAAANSTTDGVEVENYLPQERVKQELDMLHNVEAQIEALSAGVTMATKSLPQLSEQQMAAQLADLARAEQYMSRLSRVAAAISLRTSDPLTEGAHDPITELRHYYASMASSNVTLSWQDALARQSRPTTQSLGVSHVEPYADEEHDLNTLDLRLEYAQAVLTQMHDEAPCRLGLVTTWSGDLWGLRREFLPWLTYHALQGVSKIYVMYEGGDRNTLTALHDLSPHVRVLLSSPPLASSDDIAAFEVWLKTVPDSHIRDWSSQPGNYQLMTKQGYAVTRGLELARADNVTWLIHMDPDELLHPGAAPLAGSAGTAFSLLPELCGAPDHAPSIRFVNIEGVPEAADVENRYEEVTLFRAHRHLVPPAAQPFRFIFKQGHAESWLHLYTNGKSAVRPDAPGVVQGGPHVFLGPADPRWVTPDNPHGIWKPVVSNSTLVLHYAYTSPGDVAVKAGRSCPEEVVDAALAGNTAMVSKCFVLDIDQRAFVAAIKDRRAAGLPPPLPPAATASPVTRRAIPPGFDTGRTLLVDDATLQGLKTSNGFSNASWPVGKEVLNFFWGELAMSDGAPFECLTSDGKAKGWCSMNDASKLKSLLISTGLMMRLHAPAQAMKGIEAAVRQLMMISGRTAKVVHPEKAQALPVKEKVQPSPVAVGTAGSKIEQQVVKQREVTAEIAADALQQASAANDLAAAVDSTRSAGTAVEPSAVVNTGAGAITMPTTGSASANSTADILAHTDNGLLSNPVASSSTGKSSSSPSTSSSYRTSTVVSTPTSGSSVTARTAVDDEPSIWDGIDTSQANQQQISSQDDAAKHGHNSLRDKLLIA